MFKNALLYRIEHWTPPGAAQLEERLSAARFTECGASQAESAGWVEPRGHDHGPLLESVAGQWILKLGSESKAVPASVVRTQLGKLLDQAEKETGSRPRGKRARELKDDIVHSLLPRAFAKRSDTLVWIDAAAQRLLVAAGSVRKADGVVTRLVQALGGDLRLSLLQTALSPATAMAAWLCEKQPPPGFSIDRDCELKQPDSEKAAVRYARHTLDIDEVGGHIRQGKLPTQLALTWQGRVSFVLTEALALRKITLLDVALEGAGRAAAPARAGAGADGADDGFDADVALFTGEMQQLIPELVAALGGMPVPAADAATDAATASAADATPAPTGRGAVPAGTRARPDAPTRRAPWEDPVSAA